MKYRATIDFADAEDFAFFLRYIQKAKATEGTVGGLMSGLLCSGLKRAKIKTTPNLSDTQIKDAICKPATP